MPKVKLKDCMPLIEESFSRGQPVTIPVTGQSMAPTLSSGDAVTLAPPDWSQIHRGDILLYRRANGQFVLHRVVSVHKQAVDFCGDAQVVIEKNIPRSNVIAQVISYEKDGISRNAAFLRKEGRIRLWTRFPRRVTNHFQHVKRPNRLNDREILRYILSYVKRHIPAILLMSLLSVVAALSTLSMAIVSGVIIDKVRMDELHDFREWFFLLFALLIVVAGSNIGYSNLRVRVVEKIKNEMREDLFTTLLSKNYSAVQELHSGDVLTRLTSDMQTVVDTACTFVPQALSIVAKLGGGLAYMLVIEPVFTSALILLGIIVSICLRCCSRFYKSIHKECQEAEGKTRSFLQECTQNIMIIKSFDSEKGILRILNDYQQRHYKKQLRRNFFGNIGNTTIYTGFTMAYYAGLAWGVLRMAGLIGESAMMLGTFVSFLQIMEQVRAPFRNASGILPQYYSMLASADRLLDIRRLPREPRPALSYSLDEIYNSLEYIEADHVTFSYDNKNVVLVDASCRFRKGAITAIVGESGIGKSTIIKLILGFAEAQDGRLVLHTRHEDIEVSASTRGLFSYVPQGNLVLSGTLLQNLTFGRDDVTREEIDRVLDLACLTEVVKRLPDGVNTMIGERGIGLSEGQIQRLAIARALISNAPILLLDECTSALDTETERRVIANLSSLKDRTILCISHREAMMDYADDVVIVKNRKFERRVEI